MIKGKNGGGKTRLVEAVLDFYQAYLGDINYEKFGKNLDFAYCPAKPIASQFFDDAIGQGASMGQLKLFQLSQIFETKKSVYIFDEPTNFLDDSHKGWVKEKLATLANQTDSMVILISHDTGLWDLADQVIDL